MFSLFVKISISVAEGGFKVGCSIYRTLGFNIHIFWIILGNVLLICHYLIMVNHPSLAPFLLSLQFSVIFGMFVVVSSEIVVFVATFKRYLETETKMRHFLMFCLIVLVSFVITELSYSEKSFAVKIILD